MDAATAVPNVKELVRIPALIALLLQLTFWVMFTVVVGSLVGGITAALSRSQAAAAD